MKKKKKDQLKDLSKVNVTFFKGPFDGIFRTQEECFVDYCAYYKLGEISQKSFIANAKWLEIDNFQIVRVIKEKNEVR